ncbi:MAG: sensor histidine kinase [Myxococcota bacterium]
MTQEPVALPGVAAEAATPRVSAPRVLRRRPALALRVGALAALLVLGATWFAGFAVIRDQRTRETQRRREHLGHVARLVAEGVDLPAGAEVSDGTWYRWARAERRRLADAAEQTEIGGIFIVGPAGVPVAFGGEDGAMPAYTRLSAGLGRGEVVAYATIEGNPGWRVVALDPPGPRAEATAAVRRMEILSVSLGVAAGILIFIVVHALLEPVDRMARRAAEAAKAGDPGRFEEEGLPEFVALAGTLNRLGDALRQREDELRRNAEADLRREKEWARTLVAGSPVGVVLLASDGVVLDHNGLAAWAVADGRLDEAVEAAARGARPGEPLVVRGAGERLTRAVKVPGRAGGHVLFLEDVTEQRRVQTELVAAREQALTGGLAAMVAHEVRNPVHALGLHLRLLERAKDDAARAAAVDYVRGELTALRGVVDMFLDFARMDAARREDVDVAAIADGVLTRLRPVWPGVRLARGWDGAHPARLDPKLVELALVNLATNACQAISGAGRGTEVRVELAARDGGIVLAVEDDGPGIAPDLAGRLFEPFVTGRTTGTGLGLAVVRRAAQAHGGEARILLPSGGGARFEVFFPASPARGTLG